MALYNNGFPATYTQYYTPMQPQGVSPAQPSAQGGLIWVQGEAGAKSYLVAPNNTVQLWDSESQTIYLKTADATGLPSMKVLDYTIRDSNKNASICCSTNSDDKSSIYATKAEIDAIESQINVLRSKLEKYIKSVREEAESDE